MRLYVFKEFILKNTLTQYQTFYTTMNNPRKQQTFVHVQIKSHFLQSK